MKPSDIILDLLLKTPNHIFYRCLFAALAAFWIAVAAILLTLFN